LKAEKPDIKGTIQRMSEMKITRDELVESVGDVLFTPIDLSTKTKTAFTREYNKIVSVDMKKKKRMVSASDSESDEDEEVTELEEEMELLGL
jgi:predicted HAD superfamily phosphohydrolase YqeG